MARLTDDDFSELQQRLDRDTARALGTVRQASGAQRNAETETWLAAGDNLAEKAIAALDLGDEARARRLAERIVALPVVDEETRSGLMAVDVLLYGEVIDPSFEGGDARGLLDLPLRILPTLDPPAADALRHTLAAIGDFDVPAAVLRRIREVVPLERRLDGPLAGVAEEALPDAVLSVLRLVLRLRADEED
ncbi:hypothetical protein [uncultured Amnibacterium sp.]|uniref:hypothetical protein n=1 Tax=uncultured Amnibacterium sp. TaxID=1631851 RepID=UPI0035C9ACED